MSREASNPTRLNREATLAKFQQRQHARDAMGIGVIKIDKPIRAVFAGINASVGSGF